MKKNQLMIVQGQQVSIQLKNGNKYISLTAMASKFPGGPSLVKDWLRSQKTIDFLKAWEERFNPNFKGGEIAPIKKAISVSNIKLSAGYWIERTNAIGLTTSKGKYGGTYAHEQIACEFATWLSPEFKLEFILQFEALKKHYAERQNPEWNLKRELAKINYRVSTDAIQAHIIPASKRPDNLKWLEYAEEADLLNVAVFGITSRQWKDKNPQLAAQGISLRDSATTEQLHLLGNLDNYNAIMIGEHLNRETRFAKLCNVATVQAQSLKQVRSLSHERKSSTGVLLGPSDQAA